MPGPENNYYYRVPETKENLDWADLVTLDLSQYEEAEGKKALVEQLKKAVRTDGFFSVKNFNISQDEIDQQYVLAHEFYAMPLEEKLKFYDLGAIEKGEYTGYEPAGHRIVGNGIRDNIQRYHIPKFDGHHHAQHPSVFANHIATIEAFSRKCHTELIEKLLRLFAIFLELPEDRLVRDHRYDDRGEDQLFYLHYAARTPEENEKAGNHYGHGHTDLGTLTLLFPQPVAGLQVQNLEGQWKWVRPEDGKITVNAADSLTALSGGLIRSSIHRVCVPPSDQAHFDRLSLLYFARPCNHVVLNPIQDSPLLTRLGLLHNPFTDLGLELKTQDWVKVRQAQQNRRRLEGKLAADGTYSCLPSSLEILPGLQAKVYN
ncbi:hypothetical protein BJX66DRAFT_337488 [Aspergillus keveii]|uniref:Fe2OG dioxygenase domain-containing protein n=1 Tax=Aspergillus keveii TaxID=714993 RepID=A0ABR4G776_9EURO